MTNKSYVTALYKLMKEILYPLRFLKKAIIYIDACINKGRLIAAWNRITDLVFFLSIGREQSGKILIHYQKDYKNELAALCDRYGSDKGSNTNENHCYPWPAHSYTDVYTWLFKSKRDSIQAVFECGLGTTNKNISANMGEKGAPGASLRVWRDYFQNAEIFGADIDRNTLFTDTRIKTTWMDQTDPISINNALRSFGEIYFDLIIDDGLHTFEAGVSLFESAIGRLNLNGTYIIEDVYKTDVLRFKKYFEGKQFKVAYVFSSRMGDNFGDHSLIIICKGTLQEDNK